MCQIESVVYMIEWNSFNICNVCCISTEGSGKRKVLWSMSSVDTSSWSRVHWPVPDSLAWGSGTEAERSEQPSTETAELVRHGKAVWTRQVFSRSSLTLLVLIFVYRGYLYIFAHLSIEPLTFYFDRNNCKFFWSKYHEYNFNKIVPNEYYLFASNT